MDISEKLSKLGLASKEKEILKNKKVATAIDEIFDEAALDAEPQKQVSVLLHSLAALSKDVGNLNGKRALLTKAVVDGKVTNAVQLDYGWKYLVAKGDAATEQGLDAEAGVGVTVNEDDVKTHIKKYIEANKADIEEQRYKSLSSVMVSVKKIPALKFAPPALFKPIIDAEFLALLGPKDERDSLKKPKGADDSKKAAKPKTAAKEQKGEPERAHNMFTEGFLGALHKPGENPQADPKKMEEHLKATHGKVFTRFPPEPNGYLHIGHAKAITVNFGYAQYNNGLCYLRFDDTNPESEEEVYFKAIEDIVTWLGFKPYKITHSSDYFDELYELAEFLIKKDGAYVCFCTPEEVKESRGVVDGQRGGERKACKHRSTSPEENLKFFRDMRDGKYQPGEATLRMKQDLQNPNPQMWDLVAYRVLNASHARTGDKWKIYPTYDFTHCLVDSFENISHSLCTTEFYLSRESYEWLCDEVEVYRPAQREYGRLNVTGTIMSKRKIAKLVNDHIVDGWDDPRLFTLVALRRRGVPPGAILNFVAQLGVTTSTSNIQVVRFDSSIRKYLEDVTPRLMMVLDPVLVEIENLPEDYYEEIDMPFKPNAADFGTHKVPFTKRLYIDRSDFKEEAGKEFFRLTLNQPVGLLKLPYNLSAVKVEKDDTGKVTKIVVHYDSDKPAKKPKTYIQWVAESPKDKSPVHLKEVRLFNPLFKSENPSAHPDGFLADINPDSLTTYKNAIVDVGLGEVQRRSPWVKEAHNKEEETLSGKDTKGAPEAVRFQALRVGYFCLDKDSRDDAIILNRIVTLKEDVNK